MDTLEVSNDILSMLFLFIDNALKVVVLFINLLHNLLFQTNLTGYASLHSGALALMLLTSLKDLIKLSDLFLSSHLQSFHLIALICEGAIQA